jgi:hypothetical protein
VCYHKQVVSNLTDDIRGIIMDWNVDSISSYLDSNKQILIDNVSRFRNLVSSGAFIRDAYLVDGFLQLRIPLECINDDSFVYYQILCDQIDTNPFYFNFKIKINFSIQVNDVIYIQNFYSIEEFENAFKAGFNLVCD